MALEQLAFAGFAAMQPFEVDRLVEQRAAHLGLFSSALDDLAEDYCQHSRDKPAVALCETAQDEIPGARTSAVETCKVNIPELGNMQSGKSRSSKSHA